MTALKQRHHEDIKYYNARNELFKLSLMADYDQLVQVGANIPSLR